MRKFYSPTAHQRVRRLTSMTAGRARERERRALCGETHRGFDVHMRKHVWDAVRAAGREAALTFGSSPIRIPTIGSQEFRRTGNERESFLGGVVSVRRQEPV